MENVDYFYIAYGIIWAFIFGYLFYIGNMQNKIMKEIKRIEQSGK